MGNPRLAPHPGGSSNTPSHASRYGNQDKLRPRFAGPLARVRLYLFTFNSFRFEKLKALFTPYRIAFWAGAKTIYRIGILFTHTNGDFGAISVTERSCAARISKVE